MRTAKGEYEPWTTIAAYVLVMLIDTLLLWFVWDNYIPSIFKGIPSIDFWGALAIVTIGRLLAHPQVISKNK